MLPKFSLLLRVLKPLLVVLGWGASIAAAVLAAIFQGLLLPGGLGQNLPEIVPVDWVVPLFYLGILGISVLASLVIADIGRALGSFFASYGLGAAITYFVLVLPGYTGAFPSIDVLTASSIIFTFTAFFPILLFVGLAGTMLGYALSERLS